MLAMVAKAAQCCRRKTQCWLWSPRPRSAVGNPVLAMVAKAAQCCRRQVPAAYVHFLTGS